MKVMDVLRRIKSGEKVIVTLPSSRGTKKQYALTDGTDVSVEHFPAIREFMSPVDAGLFEGCEPQSWQWGG